MTRATYTIAMSFLVLQGAAFVLRHGWSGWPALLGLDSEIRKRNIEN